MSTGGPLITSQALNPGTAQATSLAPAETLASYKNDQLLKVGSAAGDFANNYNADLKIIPDAVRTSYVKFNPTTTPNGSNVLFNFRTTAHFNPSEATITIPMQFSYWNMTTTTHTQITGANGQAALNSTLLNSVNNSHYDYLFNKPHAEWLRCVTVMQCRAGNSNTMVATYSNDQYPNITSNVFIPSQREPQDAIDSNIFMGCHRNSRNANTSTFTAPATINLLTTFNSDMINQTDQQIMLSDAIPGFQSALLNNIIRSATLNTPIELTFPLKMFINMFNTSKETLFPPNFPFAFFINFNTQPFLVRAFGAFGIKGQVVLTPGTNVALPFITMNKLEFTAEGTLALNQRLISQMMNHNFFETKMIPPSNAIIPANSTSWTSQLTIASIRPIMYAIYFIDPAAVDGAFYQIAGANIVQNFTNSPVPNIYLISLNINIAGTQYVFLDRSNSTLNFQYTMQDADDIHQAKINQRFMDYTMFHNHRTKSTDIGIPWTFVIDPAMFVNENNIGTIQGPITTQITANFQEYNPVTNVLTATLRQLQAVCVEVLHSQYTILPTLDLVQVPISTKISGSAPASSQIFANRAVAA